MRNLLFCIDVHLTVLTIKLQTKLPSVWKHEMERLAPLWTLATTTHAIAQSVPQTMATLHDQVGRVLGKIFCPTLLISLGQTWKSAGGIEASRISIGYIIGIGEGLILPLPALGLQWSAWSSSLLELLCGYSFLDRSWVCCFRRRSKICYIPCYLWVYSFLCCA